MSGIINQVGARSSVIGKYTGETLGLVGMIAPFATATVPRGWLVCDGTAYNSSTLPQYAPLFAVIANTWGGSDATDFQVPDLEGAFLRGSGTSTLFTQDATVTLAAAVDDQVQTHWHGLKGKSTGLNVGANYWNIFTSLGGPTHDIASSGTLYGSGANEGRMGTETRPNNIGVKYCIKY